MFSSTSALMAEESNGGTTHFTRCALLSKRTFGHASSCCGDAVIRRPALSTSRLVRRYPGNGFVGQTVEGPYRQGQMPRRGVFQRTVADSPYAGAEHHGGGKQARHDRRVVQGAARQSMHGVLYFAD